MWFKVILNKDFSIASCEHVDSAFTDGGQHVICCEADSKLLALKYAKQLASSRRTSRERRARAKEHRLCSSCGYKRDDPRHIKCRKVASDRLQYTRSAKASGLPAPPRLIPGPKQHLSGSHRARVLAEVREKYVQMSRGDFFAWLEQELRVASWEKAS